MVGLFTLPSTRVGSRTFSSRAEWHPPRSLGGPLPAGAVAQPATDHHRLPGPGPPVVRPDAGFPARSGERRHQDLSLSRPGTVRPPGGIAVGPLGGPRHCHPREHRLPAPDGAVLLVPGRTPRAAVGSPAAVDGRPVVGGRRRDPVSVPGRRAHRSGALRSGDRLHVHPLRPPVRREDLGHPDALGRPPLAGGLRDSGPPAWRVAIPGPVRLGGCLGERHQRQLDHLRGHRPGALVAVFGRHRPGGQLATSRGGRPEGRAPQRLGLAVVGHRPAGGGGLRRQRPEVHRDGPGDQLDVAGLRGDPRASATGISTGRTGWAAGPRRRWPIPRICGWSGSASRFPSWPWPPPCWSSGASGPTSSCWSWSAWCCRWAPIPSPTRPASAPC